SRSSPLAIRRAAGVFRTRNALSTSAVSAGIRARRAARSARASAARASFVRRRRIAIPATTSSWAVLNAGGKGAGSSSASVRSALSMRPIRRRCRTSRYRACAALTRSPRASSVARAASSAFAGQPRSRETSAISASATTHLARATASFGPKARAARRRRAFARTRSPSCAIAMPRSARAGASSRRATRFSAPRGSPAASARAAAVISESIGIPPHLSLPPVRSPAVNVSHGLGPPGRTENARAEGRRNEEVEMRRVQPITVLAGILFSLIAAAEDRPTNRIDPLPRDLEIQIALSALPPHLRDNATVYVLNPAKGFEVARKGTNGFHALVARTGDDSFRGTWLLKEYRDDILYPISFDEARAKAQMPVFFDAAVLQAKGTPPGELKKIIQDRYKGGFYKAPERAGVSYMLSPVLRTYFNPEESDRVLTANYPHVMYYAPDISNDDIDGGKPGGMEPFVILHGHHGYMIQPLGVTERAAINKEYQEML